MEQEFKQEIYLFRLEQYNNIPIRFLNEYFRNGFTSCVDKENKVVVLWR